MTDIQKFFADVERIRKHNRADNNGNYDARKACTQISSLFESNNPGLGELPSSFVNYWLNTFIEPVFNSGDAKAIENEPTQEHLDKLAAMQSIIDGQKDFTDTLSNDDWKELCSLTNLEAEDLPMDVLESMMTLFVDKKAF